MLGHEYDYVIIGAGSAGCVLAKRLGENPALRILCWSPARRTPAGPSTCPRQWASW